MSDQLEPPPSPLADVTWSANDYSNFVTICAAAIGSTLLVIFKSRCSTISFCFGLWRCDREVKDETPSDDDDEARGRAARATARGAPVEPDAGA